MDNNKIFIEFIIKDTHKTLKISNEKKINMVLSAFFKDMPTLLCLDFYGVANLYDNPKEVIPNNLPKCIISYIGGNPNTIKNTFDLIKPRVDSNEVILGIIVYSKDNIPSCGTKGWILNQIIINNSFIKKLYFIDDSKKNIYCVKNLKNPYIKTYFIDKHNKPKDQLNKILYKLK
jgi:hypothetical protein